MRDAHAIFAVDACFLDMGSDIIDNVDEPLKSGPGTEAARSRRAQPAQESHFQIVSLKPLSRRRFQSRELCLGDILIGRYRSQASTCTVVRA